MAGAHEGPETCFHAITGVKSNTNHMILLIKVD